MQGRFPTQSIPLTFVFLSLLISSATVVSAQSARLTSSGSTFVSQDVPSLRASSHVAAQQFFNRSPYAPSLRLSEITNPAKPHHSAIARSAAGVDSYSFGTQADYYSTSGRLQPSQPVFRYPAGDGFLDRGYGPPPFYHPPNKLIPPREPHQPYPPPRPIPQRQ